MSNSTIHLRVNGVSRDVSQQELRLHHLDNPQQVLDAAARYLKLPPQALKDYTVDAWPGHLVVRPPAVFG